MNSTLSAPYFGDYFLIGRLAEDHLAETWLAREERNNRRAALKVFKAGSRGLIGTARQLEEWAQAAKRMRHEDIVAVYDVGVHDGCPYVSVEYPEGGTLAERLAAGEWIATRRNRKKVQNRIARLMIPIARAVHHAHQHGLIHGHLTPADVFLDASGHPRIANFGLAVLFRDDTATTGTTDGSVFERPLEDDPGSPEEITTATDIAGMGAILFHLLFGHAPDSSVEPFLRPRRPAYVNLNVDPILERICRTSLWGEPDGSYSCANEMAIKLEHWLNCESRPNRAVGQMIRQLLRWLGKPH